MQMCRCRRASFGIGLEGKPSLYCGTVVASRTTARNKETVSGPNIRGTATPGVRGGCMGKDAQKRRMGHPLKAELRGEWHKTSDTKKRRVVESHAPLFTSAWAVDSTRAHF